MFPATSLITPIAVVVDMAGTLYVADSSFLVRAYTTAGSSVELAGSDAQGYAGDGGDAIKAQLTQPRDLAASPNGGVYIADGARVRFVDASGQIRTVAGDGFAHALGDGGPASAAILNQPSAVALDEGNLYIADTGTQRVRQVQPNGTIVTLAGTGAAGDGGDGGPATAAPLNFPMGVAVDPWGNVAIADSYNHRIRQVSPGGWITTIAGTGKSGTGQDAVPPLEMQLRGPRGVCFDRAGVLFIVDTANNRILRYASGTLVETARQRRSGGCRRRRPGPLRTAQPTHQLRAQFAGRPVHRRHPQLSHPQGCARRERSPRWPARANPGSRETEEPPSPRGSRRRAAWRWTITVISSLQTVPTNAYGW